MGMSGNVDAVAGIKAEKARPHIYTIMKWYKQ
jgi:hypothetical protein